MAANNSLRQSSGSTPPGKATPTMQNSGLSFECLKNWAMELYTGIPNGLPLRTVPASLPSWAASITLKISKRSVPRSNP